MHMTRVKMMPKAIDWKNKDNSISTIADGKEKY